MTRRHVHNIAAVPFVPPSLAIKEKKAEKQRIGPNQQHLHARAFLSAACRIMAEPHRAGGLEDPKAIAKRSRSSVDEFQHR